MRNRWRCVSAKKWGKKLIEYLTNKKVRYYNGDITLSTEYIELDNSHRKITILRLM